MTTILTDAQVKAITTPILLLPAVAGKMYFVTSLFVNAHIIVNGGQSVSLTTRYVGTTTIVVPTATLISAGVNGYRNTSIAGSSINILTATDYANRGIEILGNVNAGATFETESGTRVTIAYCLLPAD
ncbi:MAG: hypothetical protein NUV51_09270 [Sulfuricaulis sp.]|nr:hypothetical protein [Sulfuricaulis sp.]